MNIFFLGYLNLSKALLEGCNSLQVENLFAYLVQTTNLEGLNSTEQIEY